MKHGPLINKSDKALGKKQDVTDKCQRFRSRVTEVFDHRHIYGIEENTIELVKWIIGRLFVIVLVLVFVLCGSGIAL